jgi:putative redox protein
MRIARATVVGESSDANYRQRIRVGAHELVADERAARGGHDVGPAPFEYLLTALGSCTSITLRMYAERHGWNIGTVTVTLDLFREAEANRIEREVAISAPLDEEQRAKLTEVCERTPVTLAIVRSVPIATRLVR